MIPSRLFITSSFHTYCASVSETGGIRDQTHNRLGPREVQSLGRGTEGDGVCGVERKPRIKVKRPSSGPGPFQSLPCDCRPGGSQSCAAEPSGRLFSPSDAPPVLGVSLTLGNSSQGGEIWGSRRRPAVQSVLGSVPPGDKGGHCPSQRAMSRASLDGELGCVGLGSPQCRHELGPHPTATYVHFCVSLPRSVQWCVGVSVCLRTHM